MTATVKIQAYLIEYKDIVKGLWVREIYPLICSTHEIVAG